MRKKAYEAISQKIATSVHTNSTFNNETEQITEQSDANVINYTGLEPLNQ